MCTADSVAIRISLGLSLCMLATASTAGELWLQTLSFTKHSKTQSASGVRYKNRHRGLGVEYHFDNEYYTTLGRTSNSLDRTLTYAVAGKAWRLYHTKHFRVLGNTGVGFFKYIGYSNVMHTAYRDPRATGVYLSLEDAQRMLAAGKTLMQDRTTYIQDYSSRGVAPWLSLSLTYKQAGLKLSYVPRSLSGGAASVFIMQLKLKLG